MHKKTLTHPNRVIYDMFYITAKLKMIFVHKKLSPKLDFLAIAQNTLYICHTSHHHHHYHTAQSPDGIDMGGVIFKLRYGMYYVPFQIPNQFLHILTTIHLYGLHPP